MLTARVVSFASWKGGTGKTTLCVLAASELAASGAKVLAIDLDSNCALTQCLFSDTLKESTSLEFLSRRGEGFSVEFAYPCGRGFDVIAGNVRNMFYANIMDTQLKVSLKRSGVLERYDYVFVDPPGYWGAHAKNAVFAADLLMLPALCSLIDYEATRLFFAELQAFGIEADVRIVVNSFSRKANPPGVFAEYQREFGEYLLPEPVPLIKSLKRLAREAKLMLRV